MQKTMLAVVVALVAAVGSPATALAGGGNSAAAKDCVAGPKGVHGACVSAAARPSTASVTVAWIQEYGPCVGFVTTISGFSDLAETFVSFSWYPGLSWPLAAGETQLTSFLGGPSSVGKTVTVTQGRTSASATVPAC